MAAKVPRCAELARAGGYRPTATAASAPVFLLVELPLPWPSDVSNHPRLQPLAAVAARHRARIQAIAGAGDTGITPPGLSRVIVQRRPSGSFVRYRSDERLVTTERLAEEVEALLEAPGALSNGAPAPVDVLVCTHGSRDVCCGGDGSRLHRQMLDSDLPGVRVWRTSHTGGHRFAPTALTFPDGRAWASLDAATLVGILGRTLDPATAVATHDRGCAAFDDPFVQAAEGAVLAVEGWRWLDMPRWADRESLDDDRSTVTVVAEAETGAETGGGADGGRLAYRAEVVVRRVVPVPDCGRPLEEARKSSPELEVVSLVREG